MPFSRAIRPTAGGRIDKSAVRRDPSNGDQSDTFIEHLLKRLGVENAVGIVRNNFNPDAGPPRNLQKGYIVGRKFGACRQNPVPGFKGERIEGALPSDRGVFGYRYLVAAAVHQGG